MAHRPKGFVAGFCGITHPWFLRAGTIACEKSGAPPPLSGKEIYILRRRKRWCPLTSFNTRERSLLGGAGSQASSPSGSASCQGSSTQHRAEAPRSQVLGTWSGWSLSCAAHLGCRPSRPTSAERWRSTGPGDCPALPDIWLEAVSANTALNIACSHTVAGIELVAPERNPHTRWNRTTHRLHAWQGREAGRQQASPAPSYSLGSPKEPLLCLTFLPRLLLLPRGGFMFGWSCRPRTPRMGCVCV